MRTQIGLPWTLFVAVAGLLLAAPTQSRADYIEIRLGAHSLWIEGTHRVLPGRIVSIRHSGLKEQLYLKLRDPAEAVYVDRIVKAPLTSVELNRKLREAEEGTLDECLDVALWVAQRGLTEHFPRLLEIMKSKSSDDPRVARLAEFWERLKQPLPEKPGQRDHIVDMVGGGLDFVTSPHYLMAVDPPGKEIADERLKLMETVYESFYLWFFLKGRELKLPDQKLMVVLYGDHDNYMLMVRRTDPELRHAAGFYHRITNVAVYFAQDTSEFGKELRRVLSEMEKEVAEIQRLRQRGQGDFIRFYNTVKLLVDVVFMGQEVEVVTHEGCHQLAANSGLLPRQVAIPIWVNEGLAAFFESPQDASWSGIGAVNERRITTYRALKDDQEHCNLEFITSDKIFTRAANVATKDAAYGPSWALTHFLMTEHFDKLMEYYDTLSRLPADMPVPEQKLFEVFKAVFGEDLTNLEQEWHFYMSKLKTLEEQLEGN